MSAPLRPPARRAVLSFLVVSACAAGVLIWLSEWRPFPGKDTIQSETHSPDHQWIATVFVRDRGVAAPLATHVNLRRSASRFRSGQESVLVLEGEIPARCVWRDDSKALTITATTTVPAHVFKRMGAFNDITLHYEESAASVLK